jgi:TolB protein
MEKRGNLFYFICLFFLILTLIPFTSPLLKENYKKGNLTYYSITFDEYNQDNPSIYKNKIVWNDDKNGNSDIYMYDLFTESEKQITNNSKNQYNPSIWENKIIWIDNRDGNRDIYLYDLTKEIEKQITFNNSDKKNIKIHDNKIIWQDNRNGNNDIYMYDLTNEIEKQITFNNSDQKNPDIYENKIVWQDNRESAYSYEIYMYDLITKIEKKISSYPSNKFYPSIYEDKITWQDNRNGNNDIYMYDLTNEIEKKVVSIESTQWNHRIYEDKIVYTNYRNPGDYYDLILYDLSKNNEIVIENNTPLEDYFSIYKNKIAYRNYNYSSKNWDILLVCEGPLVIESEEEYNNDSNIIINITPKNTLSKIKTSFEVEIKEGYNITEYIWYFEDNLTIKTISNKINYTYNSPGNHTLKIGVETFEGLNFSREFIINVNSDKNPVEDLLEEKIKELEKIKKMLNNFKSSDYFYLDKKIELDEKEKELKNIKIKLYDEFKEEDFDLIKEQLLSIKIPKYVYLLETFSSMSIFPQKNKINLEIISEITLPRFNLTDAIISEDDILNWIQNNIKIKLNQRTYKIGYNNSEDELVRIFDVLISEKEDKNYTSYLIIEDIQGLIFGKDYGQKSFGNYYYIELEKSNNSFCFSTDKYYDFSNLPLFVSPELDYFDYKINNNKKEKISSIYFWIIIIILIIIFSVIYILLQEWYKSKYEKYLFKSKNNLYNLLIYIKSNISSGSKKKEITLKLKRAGWNLEQINYAFKKFEGRKTGMFEIIPVSKFLNKLKMKKIERKQNTINSNTNIPHLNKIDKRNY